MKKTLITALLAVTTLTTMADDDLRYLTLQTTTQDQSIELATIQKITFEDTNVLITTTKGTVTFAQAEVQKLYFSATPTAIAQLAEQSKGLVVTNGSLVANGSGLLYVYNPSGVLMQMAKVEGKTRISLGNLPKGLYIVSLNGETIKLTKR